MASVDVPATGFVRDSTAADGRPGTAAGSGGSDAGAAMQVMATPEASADAQEAMGGE